MMKANRIDVYKFDGVYGFGYQWRGMFGNRNPTWVRFVAKVVYRLTGGNFSIKFN